MSRGELTDKQWERLRPLLPPRKPPTGRTAYDHRRIINGLLWILRTGTRLGHRGDATAAALGRNWGRLGTKVHLRAAGEGRPLTLRLTPGQQHAASAFERLMEQCAM